MELSKIKVFFYAARSSSFTGTGLALSSSVISRHVQDLENQFDIKLFYRTSKGLVLVWEQHIVRLLNNHNRRV
jgi:DNA-binding transcriptional LysR family regulator